MSNKSYLNKDGEQLYVLHFPGTGIEGHEYIIEQELDREIVVSANLSIISIMDKKCWDTSPVRIQCEKNNIPLYNTALDEREWNNTIKINHILNCLEQITTDYVLIVDGRDVIFVNDLDDNFIEKYKQFNKPIIYNGTPVSYPNNVIIEPLNELLNIKGKQRYLNAGVCIGERETLKEFYQKAEIEKRNVDEDNRSEQLLIRKTKVKNPHLVWHDTDNKIFRIVHKFDTTINWIDENTCIII